jgi:hypothetical protein
MFPLNVLTYVKAGLLIASILFSGYLGYSFEHSRFVAYKIQVETAGKAQEAENASKDKQAALITSGVKNEYEAKLANLRNFYGSGLHVNSSSGKTEGLSPAPTGTDASAAYSILVGQCSQTTLMLTELQAWIRQQAGI